MYKKAQAEILGLVIFLVILIVLGTFLLLFSIRDREEQENIISSLDTSLAQGFLISLMNTEIDEGVVIKDIVRDCYSDRNDLCGRGYNNSCICATSAIRNAAKTILTDTNRNYRLHILSDDPKDNRIKDIPLSGNCTELSEKYQPGFYVLPNGNTPIIFQLDICK